MKKILLKYGFKNFEVPEGETMMEVSKAANMFVGLHTDWKVK